MALIQAIPGMGRVSEKKVDVKDENRSATGAWGDASSETVVYSRLKNAAGRNPS